MQLVVGEKDGYWVKSAVGRIVSFSVDGAMDADGLSVEAGESVGSADLVAIVVFSPPFAASTVSSV